MLDPFRRDTLPQIRIGGERHEGHRLRNVSLGRTIVNGKVGMSGTPGISHFILATYARNCTIRQGVGLCRLSGTLFLHFDFTDCGIESP